MELTSPPQPTFRIATTAVIRMNQVMILYMILCKQKTKLRLTKIKNQQRKKTTTLKRTYSPQNKFFMCGSIVSFEIKDYSDQTAVLLTSHQKTTRRTY